MKVWITITTCLIGLTSAASALAFPWYASGEGIWGAELMTPEERGQYVKRIQGMKGYEECKAYVEEHRREILSRARAKQITLPPPGGNPCDVMLRMGRFSGDAQACPLPK